MKISEALEAVARDEGDVDLALFGPSGAQGVTFRVVNLRRPARRERNLYFWNTWDPPESKGRRVATVSGGDLLRPDDPLPREPRAKKTRASEGT